MCFYSDQGRFQSGGGGGEAGRPDRVPETAQHFAQQEAAQPHRSALTAAGLFLPVWLHLCALKTADLRRKTGSNELKHWIEECKVRTFLLPRHLCTRTQSGRVRPRPRWTDNGGGDLLLKGQRGGGVVGHRSEVEGFYRRVLLFAPLRDHLMGRNCFRDRRKREEKRPIFFF